MNMGNYKINCKDHELNRVINSHGIKESTNSPGDIARLLGNSAHIRVDENTKTIEVKRVLND